MADKVDKVITTAIATLVGVILMASVVIPISVGQIATLTGDAAQYAPMLGVVLTMALVGLIIYVVRSFSVSKE